MTTTPQHPGTLPCQTKGVEALADYLAKRDQQPLKGLDDTIHAIHTGTQYEAELRLSDLQDAVNNHASLKARCEALEGLLAQAVNLLDEARSSYIAGSSHDERWDECKAGFYADRRSVLTPEAK